MNAQVTADFVTLSDSGCAPFVATFADSSTGNITYRHWDFGNTNTATGNNVAPSAIYNNPGVYNVTLTVSDGVDTASITKFAFITVLSLPNANFTYQNTITGCAEFNFAVSDNSSPGSLPIDSWKWDFDDGTPLVVGQSVNHNYHNPGVFSVTLIVSDSLGCSDSRVISNLVSVLPKPVANFYSNDSLSVCGPPLTINILNTSTGSSALTYNWTVGGVNYNTAHISPTFTTSGGFNAELIVTNSIGCSDTLYKPFYVWIGSIVANMTIPDTACLDAPTEMINSSYGGSTYSWDFGDGDTAVGDTVFHTYTNTGNYTVTLVSSAGSVCDDSTTQNIYVESVQAAFTSSPHFACEFPLVVNFTDQTPGNIVAWEWHFGNLIGPPPNFQPNISYLQNPVNNYMTEDIFDDTLTVTSANGCKGTMIIPANEQIILTNAEFTASEIEGCMPLVVDFTNITDSVSRIGSWYWDYDDGSPKDFTFSPTHTFVDTGVYDVNLTVISIMGCTTTYFMEVRVGSPQIANFTIDTLIACGSDTVNFTNLSSDTSLINEYLWVFGDGTTTDGFEPFHLFLDTGILEVTLVAKFNGCPDTLNLPTAIEILGPITSVFPGYSCDSQNVVSFTTYSLGGTDIYWDFGDSSAIDSIHWNPTHTFAAHDSNYQLTVLVTDSTTGCEQTISNVTRIRYLSADVMGADTTICKDDKVIFSTDSSINSLAYVLWSMNSLSNPQVGNSIEDFTFNQKGAQTIYVVVRDEHNCLDTASQSVYVYEPVPQFSFSPNSGCAPLAVQFSDLSTSDTNIVSWLWDLGNGNTTSVRNPTYVYNGNGNVGFNLKLLVTDTFGCSNLLDSLSAITVFEPPSSFASLNTQVCANTLVGFINQPLGAFTYLWDFGDGTTSTLASPQHAYAAGIFDVSLTVTDQMGCDSTFVETSYIEVEAIPTADFTANPITIDCYPASISFTDSSTYSSVNYWTWNFGDSPNDVVLYGVGAQNFYNQPGVYDITMVITTLFGCTDTIVKYNYITIGGPTGTVTHNPDIGCVDDEVSFDVANTNSDAERFIWDFGDGVVDTTYSPNIAINHTYAVDGFYNVSLLLSDIQGNCNKNDTSNIEVDLVQAGFLLSDTMGCTPVQFGGISTSIGEDILDWYVDGTKVSQIPAENFTITGAGTHEIMLLVSNSHSQCSDSVIKTVVVHPLPNLSITPNSVICIEDSLQLNASGASEYYWTPSLWLNQDSISNPISVPLDDIMYTVIGIDSNNCENIDSVTLTVQQKPELIWITPDTFIFVGDEIQLNTTTNFPITYHWSPRFSMGCTECPNPIVKPGDSTTYTLVYGDFNNCFSFDTTVTVVVSDEFEVYIPNTFTPDGDNLNDVFIPVTYGIEEVMYMIIYDRWGKLVFETEEPDTGWDGKVNGKISAHNSVYSYMVRAKRFNGEIKDFVGMVILILITK